MLACRIRVVCVCGCGAPATAPHTSRALVAHTTAAELSPFCKLFCLPPDHNTVIWVTTAQTRLLEQSQCEMSPAATPGLQLLLDLH